MTEAKKPPKVPRVIHECGEPVGKDGKHRCSYRLSKDWDRCPFHTVKLADSFATELEDGAQFPSEPLRHHLLALGAYVAAEPARINAALSVRTDPKD